MLKNKQTLFDYVYNDLCSQIKRGRLSYGDKLPSMSQLCELYHVGIRTVKDVMSALKKGGYIRTEERKAATVIYDRDNTDRDSAVQSVLRQKTAIIQTYETMALILPPIFALSALVCNAEKMQEWAPAFKNFDSKAPEKRKKSWCPSSAFFWITPEIFYFGNCFLNMNCMRESLYSRMNRNLNRW